MGFEATENEVPVAETLERVITMHLHGEEILHTQQRPAFLIPVVKGEDAGIKLAAFHQTAVVRNLAGLLRNGAFELGMANDSFVSAPADLDVPNDQNSQAGKMQPEGWRWPFGTSGSTMLAASIFCCVTI